MQPRKARLPGWQWLIGVLGKTMRARSTAKTPSMTMGRRLNHSLISRKVTPSAYGPGHEGTSCRGMIRNSPWGERSDLRHRSPCHQPAGVHGRVQ